MSTNDRAKRIADAAGKYAAGSDEYGRVFFNGDDWERFVSEIAAETDAARDVLAERQRQISVEGWTPAHDDEHVEGELSMAAAGYAISASDQIQCAEKQLDDSTLDDSGCASSVFPHGWQFNAAPPRRMLVKACALLLAEIERIDRAAISDAQIKAAGVKFQCLYRGMGVAVQQAHQVGGLVAWSAVTGRGNPW